MTPTIQPTRVAVLGGGPAALAAAFELTATPELQEQYEVTVHQLGWRLGGKGASGRNAAKGQRIEEHGLHIWFGFYDNAFSLIRRCYEELAEPADAPLRRPDAPLATWDEAFKPEYGGVQYECYEGNWVPHYFDLPPNDMEPGDTREIRFWEILGTATSFLEGQWRSLREQNPAAAADAALHPKPAVDEGRVIEESERLGLDFEDWTATPALKMLELVQHFAENNSSETVEHGEGLIERGMRNAGIRFIAQSLDGTRDYLWHRSRNRMDDNELRFFLMLLDLTAAMVRGIADDKLWQHGFGHINNEDFRAWLGRHGARDLTLEWCPVVRAIYDAAFCFENGDLSKPNVAAGKAAQDAIRLPFYYKGAPMYKMQAGMGDTVFGPLYEVLRRRGVRFEFFHCVTQLGVSADKRDIDRIQYVQQADLRAPEYRPLIDVNGLPCWPSEPDWSQLVDGDALRAQKADLERQPNPLDRPEQTLRKGEHFDAVVLGIPVGALRSICPELMDAHEPFKAMVDNSHTVMTQAFQVWASSDGAGLGSHFPPGTLGSCYREPVDTFCDMSQLLQREAWPPGDDVKLVAYFCGVLPNTQAPTQGDGDSSVKAAAIQFLDQHVCELWPHFNWDVLFDPEDAQGDARFDAQYWRANFTDSDRYVLTLAGSVQYRLWPKDSGFRNLALAGDWTRNGIDAGCVEAAVTSGMLASQAISGEPAEVGGVDDWLTSDKGDAGWVAPEVPHG
jgi:uncharacterized protein with NAD-binding domain and iron-sulfur cluster